MLSELKFVLAMPVKVTGIWPDFVILRQVDVLAKEFHERFLVRARLVKCLARHDHPVFVVDRPKPVVKQPMRILAQCESVARVVVSRIRELMDVSRINDRRSGNRSYPITGEGAGVVVGRHDVQAEACLASRSLRILRIEMSHILGNLVVGWHTHSKQ